MADDKIPFSTRLNLETLARLRNAQTYIQRVHDPTFTMEQASDTAIQMLLRYLVNYYPPPNGAREYPDPSARSGVSVSAQLASIKIVDRDG